MTSNRVFNMAANVLFTSKASLMGVNFAKMTQNVVQNGTACFKIVNNCLNTNIYSYLETSGGQSYNLYLNVVHFFNTSLN